MAKIGVLYGMEESFPPALVDRINAMGMKGVCAEHLKVGGVRMAVPRGARYPLPCRRGAL